MIRLPVCSSISCLCALALTACGSKPAVKGADSVDNTDTTGATDGAGTPSRTVTATLVELQMGDLACYVDYDDGSGAEGGGLPGSFEVCDQTALIGQPVVLTIEPGNMADCESAEPCGKTVVTDMVVKIEPAPAAAE